MSRHPQSFLPGHSGWCTGVACRVLVLLALASPAVAFAAPVPKVKPLNKLFVATSDGKAFLLNPDGTQTKSLLELSSPEELITATLSADGKRLVYTVGTDSTRKTRVVRVRDLTTGKEKTALEVGCPEELIAAMLSPDGKRLAYAVQKGILDPDVFVRVRDLNGDKPTELTMIPGKGKGQRAPQRGYCYCSWSPDGQSLYGVSREFAADKLKLGQDAYTAWKLDPATGKRTDLITNSPYRIEGLTPGGDEWIGSRIIKSAENNRQMTQVETVRFPLDKLDSTVLIPDTLGVYSHAAFPDGKRWLVMGDNESGEFTLGVYTTGEKKAVMWAKLPPGDLSSTMVSPDGSRVVFVVTSRTKGDDTSTVWVADSDGKNAKKILERKGLVRSVEWR